MDSRYYWSLPSHDHEKPKRLRQKIESAGYEIPSSARKDDLLAILRYAERQRPNYRTCAPKELRTFAIQRNLMAEIDKKSKKELVETLEDGDEKGTFPFMSLIPELRSKVYDWYMKPFPRKLGFTGQPPLSRTCRLVRSELLPMFHAKFYFTIDLTTTMNCEGKRVLKFDADTNHCLNTVIAKDLAAMRFFQLTVHYKPDGTRFYAQDVFRFEVTMNYAESSEGALFKIKEATDWTSIAGSNRVMARDIELALREYANSRASQEEKLNVRDIRNMRNKIEDKIFSATDLGG